jgi:DnaJ-class molecular chaperone
MEENYTCSDCGATNIKPFSNGDGKHRCEKCAVEFYKANRFSLLTMRAADICPRCEGAGQYADYIGKRVCALCDGTGKRR